MAWIESHQALDRHPKIVMLKARMRWSQNETIGFVHRLWWLVLEYAPTSGDLRALPPMVVGELLGMKESDVAKAIEHMVDVGLIDKSDDGGLFIHDWNDFGGKYQAKKDLARQRVKRHRDSCNANVRVTDALPMRNVRECNALDKIREDKIREDKIREDKKEARRENAPEIESAFFAAGFITVPAAVWTWDYPLEWIKSALSTATAAKGSAPPVQYLHGILRRYAAQGGLDKESPPRKSAARETVTEHNERVARAVLAKLEAAENAGKGEKDQNDHGFWGTS